MRFRPTLLLALTAAAAVATRPAAAQVGNVQTAPRPGDARRTLEAVRLGDAAPTIDGRFDDAAWALAPVGTDFVQLQPQPGEPASERTEIRVLYDDHAVYVAARMYDASPDAIVAALARRDQLVYSDWIFVALDSYHDRRTAFVFALNPRGVKADLMLYDDTSEDDGWDAVWYGAARIDSLGWTAEFRIPLSQLRFSAAGDAATETVWGVNFMRRIARRNEESFWSPLRRDVQAVVSAFGDLAGLRGLSAPRRLELQPYALSRVTRAPGDAADPFHRRTAGRFDAGGDMKYGITSDLTLTATLNPDFGQVEADPSVVNLSAFESFFPERRPFFVEGADIFRFGIGVGDGGGGELLFYSRRIGRAPQGGLPVGARWRDVPDAAPILGATKLSGKTAGGWSIGLMNATTGAVSARYATADGPTGVAPVEPATNYAVGRLIRDFRAGETAIGAIATATNRRIDDDALHFLRSAAYTGGVTARHRFGEGRFQLNGWIAGSHVRGDTLALRLTQQSPARYFQRPDGEPTRFDATRTSLSGYAASIELLKMSGGHWRWAGILNARSPGFEINDLGFQNSADQLTQVAYIGYDQYRPTRHFRRWSINVNQWTGWTFDGERLSTGGNVNGSFERPSYRGASLGVDREMAATSVHALRGGPALSTPGRTNLFVHVYTDRRRPVNGSISANAAREDGTGGYNFSISPTLRVRPSDRIDLSVAPRYAINRAAWQYVGRRVVGTEPYYLFAELDQTTTALTARLSYTFTPNLSLQFYAQPFISAGGYTSFMEVADPRAATFAQRFRRYPADAIAYDERDGVYRVDRNGDGTADLSFANPDFNVKQFRSNAVLRWEYRPGSTLFLVWSQGRSQRDVMGDYAFRRDVGDLWASPAANVLLLKMSYWLGV